MRRSRMWWLARGGLPALAFFVALIAFRAGVDVSQRPGVPQSNLLTQVYYCIGLFLMAGIDLGLPDGGPEWARMLLWADYFAAPLITTGVLVEGALRLFQPQWMVRVGLRDHIVIVGAGRLGMLVLQALHTSNPKRRLLLVDRDASRASIELAQNRYGARFLAADVRNAPTLTQLALHRAHAVILLTDDDLVNLETAWRVAENGVRAVAHVGDIAMSRAVQHVEHDERVHVFNSHRIAAERLYRGHLEAYFASTEGKDTVVLAGFGRFGQTILEYLHVEAHDHLERVVVVDVQAQRRVRLFRAQVASAEDCSIVAVEGDVADPQTWAEVDGIISSHSTHPVLVLGTDDDPANLRAAVTLRLAHPKARIFVRCVYQSAFTRQLSQRLSFEVLAIEELLRDALTLEHERWLRG